MPAVSSLIIKSIFHCSNWYLRALKITIQLFFIRWMWQIELYTICFRLWNLWCKFNVITTRLCKCWVCWIHLVSVQTHLQFYVTASYYSEFLVCIFIAQFLRRKSKHWKYICFLSSDSFGTKGLGEKHLNYLLMTRSSKSLF